MQLIDAELLERSTKFHQGRPLPTALQFVEMLNLLDTARLNGDNVKVAELEHKIRDLASGVYEGHIDDVGLEVGRVRVVSIYSTGSGADMDTFRITLEILDGFKVVGTKEMDLVEFLADVNRESPTGSQKIDKRFRPY